MTTNSSRNPLLALLASLILPGLGQIYNGQFLKGLFLGLSLVVMAPVATWLALHSSKHLILLVLILFMVLAMVIYLFSLVDAYRSAKRTGTDHRPTAINRPYVYFVLVIVGYLLVFGGFHFIGKHLMQTYQMTSSGMLPNVLPGDDVLVDKRDNCRGCKGHLLHGNLVVFVSPKDHHTVELERVIGLPGDEIVIKGTHITLNGVPMRSEDVTEFSHAEVNNLLETHSAWREKCSKAVYAVVSPKNVTIHADTRFTVPAGQLYVLNDNRGDVDYSLQSNAISMAAVIGVAKQAWLSKDMQHGMRWWRTGFPVEANY